MSGLLLRFVYVFHGFEFQRILHQSPWKKGPSKVDLGNAIPFFKFVVRLGFITLQLMLNVVFYGLILMVIAAEVSLLFYG